MLFERHCLGSSMISTIMMMMIIMMMMMIMMIIMTTIMMMMMMIIMMMMMMIMMMMIRMMIMTMLVMTLIDGFNVDASGCSTRFTCWTHQISRTCARWQVVLMVMAIACHCVSRVLLIVSHKVGDERLKVLKINEDRRRSKVEKAGDAFPSLRTANVANFLLPLYSSHISHHASHVVRDM